jgi:hypothetical protein
MMKHGETVKEAIDRETLRERERQRETETETTMCY